MSDLPRMYQQLRTLLRSADNALDAAEAAGIAARWGAKHQDGREFDAVEAKAIKTIEDRLYQLCEFAGVRSRQCIGLTDQIYALQEENRMLRERLKHADAALVRLTSERRTDA